MGAGGWLRLALAGGVGAEPAIGNGCLSLEGGRVGELEQGPVVGGRLLVVGDVGRAAQVGTAAAGWAQSAHRLAPMLLRGSECVLNALSVIDRRGFRCRARLSGEAQGWCWSGNKAKVAKAAKNTSGVGWPC